MKKQLESQRNFTATEITARLDSQTSDMGSQMMSQTDRRKRFQQIQKQLDEEEKLEQL